MSIPNLPRMVYKLKNTNFAYFINTNTKISKQMISLNISFRCLFSGDK